MMMCEEEREELWLEGGGVRYVYTDDYVDSICAKVAELEDIANDYKQQISDQAIEIDDNQDYMKAQQSLISDQKNAIQALEAQLAKYQNLEPVAWISAGGDVTRSRKLHEDMGFATYPLYALEK